MDNFKRSTGRNILWLVENEAWRHVETINITARLVISLAPSPNSSKLALDLKY